MASEKCGLRWSTFFPTFFWTISKFSTCKVSGLPYELSKGFPRHFWKPLGGSWGGLLGVLAASGGVRGGSGEGLGQSWGDLGATFFPV